jgi:hypothetical protein
MAIKHCHIASIDFKFMRKLILYTTAFFMTFLLSQCSSCGNEEKLCEGYVGEFVPQGDGTCFCPEDKWQYSHFNGNSICTTPKTTYFWGTNATCANVPCIDTMILEIQELDLSNGHIVVRDLRGLTTITPWDDFWMEKDSQGRYYMGSTTNEYFSPGGSNTPFFCWGAKHPETGREAEIYKYRATFINQDSIWVYTQNANWHGDLFAPSSFYVVRGKG